MRCEDAQREWLAGDEADAAAKAHVEGCAACQAFGESAQLVFNRAALPAVTATEKASLQPLAGDVMRAYERSQRRKSRFGRAAGLAIAASIGAAVASAALLPSVQRGAAHSAPLAEQQSTAEWVMPEVAFTDSSLGPDDELDFEVSWPTTEGDVP